MRENNDLRSRSQPSSHRDPCPMRPEGLCALDGARARIKAEINSPLTGVTHGSWDRGRVAGLREALALLSTPNPGKEG